MPPFPNSPPKARLNAGCLLFARVSALGLAWGFTWGLTWRNFPLRYLTTYLMYEFYICSCLGALLAMAMPLNSTVSVFLATARLVVVPLTFCYESMPGVPASTIPRSNVVALAVNFFFIVSGAWVFTSTFSVLQTKLADYPEDKKWALNLNNGIYFLAMIVALGISIAIGFFVWGTQ